MLIPMRFRSRATTGFSLFEVVIAVGIFALAISVMIGLLPSLTRQSATAIETQNALRLPDAVRSELERVAIAGGFDALAARVSTLASPVPDTLELIAIHDASAVQSLDYQPPPAEEQIGIDDRYFLIEAWKFPDAPLAFESAGASLALHVRVSWPYHLPNSAVTTLLANREQLTFNLALRR